MNSITNYVSVNANAVKTVAAANSNIGLKIKKLVLKGLKCDWLKGT